jgi:hypothetical protein
MVAGPPRFRQGTGTRHQIHDACDQRATAEPAGCCTDRTGHEDVDVGEVQGLAQADADDYWRTFFEVDVLLPLGPSAFPKTKAMIPRTRDDPPLHDHTLAARYWAGVIGRRVPREAMGCAHRQDEGIMPIDDAAAGRAHKP